MISMRSVVQMHREKPQYLCGFCVKNLPRAVITPYPREPFLHLELLGRAVYLMDLDLVTCSPVGGTEFHELFKGITGPFLAETV
jgi:hypothetical protein